MNFASFFQEQQGKFSMTRLTIFVAVLGVMGTTSVSLWVLVAHHEWITDLVIAFVATLLTALTTKLITALVQKTDITVEQNANSQVVNTPEGGPGV